LCSRTSFFGGSISTREASSSLVWRDTLPKSFPGPKIASKSTKKVPLPVIPKKSFVEIEHKSPKYPQTPANPRGLAGDKENHVCNVGKRKRQINDRQHKPILKRHQQSTALGVQTVELLRIPEKTPLQTEQKSVKACAETPVETHVLQKQRLQGTFYGSSQPPAALQPIKTVDDESASDLESFIESDDEDSSWQGDKDQGHELNDWKRELQAALGGYDPSKYASIDARPLGRMRATYQDITAEEIRAARIGREIDRNEAKAAVRRKTEKQAKKQLRELLGDDVVSSDSSDSDDEESEDEDEVESQGKRSRRRRVAAYVV
jgi:hypothetical protein